MGPVRSVRNQYLGVNAHLHSALQDEGGWGNFHTRHIVHLADWLNRQVRSLGYIAVVEDSLQIRRMDESVRRPKSDITIYDVQPLRAGDGPAAANQGGVGLLLLVRGGPDQRGPVDVVRAVLGELGQPDWWPGAAGPGGRRSRRQPAATDQGH